MFQASDWLFDFIGSYSHEKSRVTPSLGLVTDVTTNLYGLGAEVHRSNDMSDTSLSFNRVRSFDESSAAHFADCPRTNVAGNTHRF